MTIENKIQPTFLQRVRNFSIGTLFATVLATTTATSCDQDQQGCNNDSECRDPRICVAGNCVNPGGNDTYDTGSPHDVNGNDTYDTGSPHDTGQTDQTRNDQPICTSHANKVCHDGDVYWRDNCGELEGMFRDCSRDEYCESGQCLPTGEPDLGSSDLGLDYSSSFDYGYGDLPTPSCDPITYFCDSDELRLCSTDGSTSRLEELCVNGCITNRDDEAVCRSWQSVSAGDGHTCAIDQDNFVYCWGSNTFGETTLPGTVESSNLALQAGAGSDHSCMLDRGQIIYCWGRNDDGQSTVPSGLYRALAVGNGSRHTCALRSGGIARCWGENDFGQTDSPGTAFEQIGAGSSHNCAIRIADQNVECWGDNSVNQSNPPDGSFTEVAAGSYHSCGILLDESTVCWGRDGLNSPMGNFSAVGVGFNFACGIKTDDTLFCWGLNDYGQSNPPRGEYEILSVGVQHACAINTSGGIRCWGRNNEGQATPPR